MHTIHPKGQDLIFKLKISSSSRLNHRCFRLLIGLRHTSHVWISDSLVHPIIRPRRFYCPLMNLLELTHPLSCFHIVLFWSLFCYSLLSACSHTHTCRHTCARTHILSACCFHERRNSVSLDFSTRQPYAPFCQIHVKVLSPKLSFR